MAKVVLNNVASGYGTVDVLNANFDAIEVAFENTLSRDGTSPNQMQANLDMNAFAILNAASLNGVPASSFENLTDIPGLVEDAEDSAAAALAAQQSAEAALASVTTNLEALASQYVRYSGTGAQTSFTLPVAVLNEDFIDVFISGVYQQKTAYSVSGQALLFSVAPALGTNNIEVRIAPNIAFIQPSAADWGLITSAVTADEDYGALI